MALIFVHGCVIKVSYLFMWQAAEFLSSKETESFPWGKSGNTIVRNFSLATVQILTTYLSSGTDSNLWENWWNFKHEFACTLYCNWFFKIFAHSGPGWSIGDNLISDVDVGLLTSKVRCLIDTLLEYRLSSLIDFFQNILNVVLKSCLWVVIMDRSDL